MTKRIISSVLIVLLLLSSVAAASTTERVGNTPKGGVMSLTTTTSGLTTKDLNAVTPEQLVNSLLGSGITVTNVKYTGANVAAGTFDGGSDNIGIKNGIVLSSGAISSVVGPNQHTGTSTNNGMPEDTDLNGLIPGYSTHDAASLEFSFIPDSDKITFKYVFGSEEYNEYVGYNFNDVFGFFLNGKNIALIPETSTPVSINNVNLNSYSDFYRNNEGAIINTELDGLTTILNVTAPVNKGQENTIKLAIADAGDSALDSDVFIEAGSFTSVKPSYAYITNSGDNTVSVIDTAKNTVTATVSVGPGSWGVAVNPAGTKVYVANRGSGTVSVIDTATNKVTATLKVKIDANGVAVTPDGTKVYVTNSASNDVSVIDTATNKVTGTFKVGKGASGVAVTPDGKKAYVVNIDSHVSVIDTTTNKVKATVKVGNGANGANGVAVTPDGKKVYVTNSGFNSVSVIDTEKNKVTATLKVGNNPTGVAVNPAGTKVYVANRGDGTVSVIDAATNKVTSTVKVGSYPFGVSVTSDGTKVYVANSGSNSVSVIDTATNKVTATVPVGSKPIAFGQFICL